MDEVLPCRVLSNLGGGLTAPGSNTLELPLDGARWRSVEDKSTSEEDGEGWRLGCTGGGNWCAVFSVVAAGRVLAGVSGLNSSEWSSEGCDEDWYGGSVKSGREA